MQDRLVTLWARAMRNPALDAAARAHIEQVLSLEFLAVINARRQSSLPGRLQRLAPEPAHEERRVS